MDVAAREIADALGGELIGDGELRIHRIGPLEGADAHTIAFLANPRYRAQLDASQAGCVIVASDLRDAVSGRPAAILTAEPYLFFARLTQWWAARTRTPPTPGIHPSAVVDAGAMLGQGVVVQALAVIEAGAVIGDFAVIGAHGFIGRGARIGAHSRLAARVTVGSDCSLGARCIVHSGVVIGADGFGFAPTEGRWEKIEQLGAVRIGDDVEIGANTCIDRGALDDTVIEDGVKIDNLVQIGHNVHVGAHCTLGGGAIVLGHLSLADDVNISAASVVMRSIRAAGHYSGVFPIDENAAWEKNAATLRQLHRLRERLRALENKVR